MKSKYILLLTLLFNICAAVMARAQGEAPPTPVAPPSPDTSAPVTRKVVPLAPQIQPSKLQSFKFESADLDTVMTMYCEWTHKIYMKNDSVTASISLKADKLTVPECVEIVEAALAMNNIALVPMGEKFIKVVQATAPDLTGYGLDMSIDPDTTYKGSDRLVTQIIPLKNVQIPEVQTAIQHIMHSYGKIQTLEGSNSLLVTDTEANILRIRELVDFIDQASARIEPRIYEIHYADATEIASKLNEIVALAQADQQTSTRSTTARTIPGVIRARSTQQQVTTPTQATISSTEGGNKAIIQGTVKIMADERTNLILIFSQTENFDFFTKIINVLDVEVEPAITFEVINLEYADAEELSGTLNDLVGAAQETRSTTSSGSSSTSSRLRSTSGTSTQTSTGRTGGITDRITPNAEAVDTASIENLSKLSESTKILADKRSNSILLMGRRSDIAAIKNVIAHLDIMLEQVLIEAAIFEVTLGDELRHGIDWLYRDTDPTRVGAWDGLSLLSSTNGLGSVAAGALTYYQNITGINTEIAINLAASDSNVRLLATPVVMTTDNTEATLSVGEQRPVVTSTETLTTGNRSAYEYKDIGINLTVTPRINPQRVVVMEIDQKADQVGDDNVIDGNKVPTILNRQFTAQIAVPNRGTIALGGLVNTETRDTVSKIPILGDIPLLGRFLFSNTSKINRQNELVVLMTPYVLTNEDEMRKETQRLYDSTDMMPRDWPEGGWSDSSLQYREKNNRSDKSSPNKNQDLLNITDNEELPEGGWSDSSLEYLENTNQTDDSAQNKNQDLLNIMDDMADEY